MKHLIATLAVGFSMALASLCVAIPAGAGGKPSYGCPPGFMGPLNLQQYLGLPRNREGFVAGVYDVENRTSAFNGIDLNGDGMICAKDVAASVGSGATPIWQYFYNIVDDDSSAPTR